VTVLLPPPSLAQLVRTRQVQNDVVMIIFQEGNMTYDPLIMPTNVTRIVHAIIDRSQAM
jgi:hypothetical protein